MAYLTAQQVRDRARSDDLSDTDLFSDDTLEDLIAEFEEIAEDYCGRAFVTRTATDETHELHCAHLIVVNSPLQSVTEITLEDTAFTSYTLNDADNAAGVIRFDYPVTGTLVLTYEYGPVSVPKRIERACVQYVRACALRDDSNTGRDTYRESFGGDTSTSYVTPDYSKERPTGYLEPDRLLNSFGARPPGVA